MYMYFLNGNPYIIIILGTLTENLVLISLNYIAILRMRHIVYQPFTNKL